MNASSVPAPREVDEFEYAGLTKADSRLVRCPPRGGEPGPPGVQVHPVGRDADERSGRSEHGRVRGGDRGPHRRACPGGRTHRLPRAQAPSAGSATAISSRSTAASRWSAPSGALDERPDSQPWGNDLALKAVLALLAAFIGVGLVVSVLAAIVSGPGWNVLNAVLLAGLLWITLWLMSKV